MPPSEQVVKQGGKHSVEVQIGLSRSDVVQLLLVGRRLRAYADQNYLVEPLALDRLAHMVFDALPPEELITWLDTAAARSRVAGAFSGASSSGPDTSRTSC